MAFLVASIRPRTRHLHLLRSTVVCHRALRTCTRRNMAATCRVLHTNPTEPVRVWTWVPRLAHFQDITHQPSARTLSSLVGGFFFVQSCCLFKRCPSGTNFLNVEQEYDAPADMLDEDPSDHSAGPGPYPDAFYNHSMPANQRLGMGMQPHSPMQLQPPSASQVMDAHGMFSMGQPLDPFNPMLDADPFGLDRSMHFPTQFTS